MLYDVVIIGAGITGGMLARELSKYCLSVCLLEKENDVACGASKANSGIIHGGFDPEPGTLKAQLNVKGAEMLFAIASELNVSHKRNGSFVCAFGADEEAGIEKLYARGIENGVVGMEILSGDEARAVEPYLSSEITKVLSVPSAGIISPYELTIAAIGNAMDNGAELLTNFDVGSINYENEEYIISSIDGKEVFGKYVVNCAGVNADKIAQLIGDNSFEIFKRAGEYMLLDKIEGNRVSHTIFQLPSKAGKGILVSPTAEGNLLCGPTADIVDFEDKKTTADGLEKVKTLAKKSVPSVALNQVITSFCGVRACEKNGDFIIEESKFSKGFVNVAAIDSPGLSCCAAIAEKVVGILNSIGLEAAKKSDFNAYRADSRAFSKMDDDAKNEYIKKHPEYGKIVCRCEGVSEGEIREAIRVNPPANDLDGVKRRTRSGMGRCQGGFCAPYVMRLIAEERGIQIEQVTKNGGDSEMTFGKL